MVMESQKKPPSRKRVGRRRSHNRDEVSQRRRAFGSQILDARRAHGLSQEDLARKIDVTPAYVCQLEKGDRLPSDRVCEALAEAIPSPDLQTPRVRAEVHRLRYPSLLDESPEKFEELSARVSIKRLMRRLERLPLDEVDKFAEFWLRSLELVPRPAPVGNEWRERTGSPR